MKWVVPSNRRHSRVKTTISIILACKTNVAYTQLVLVGCSILAWKTASVVVASVVRFHDRRRRRWVDEYMGARDKSRTATPSLDHIAANNNVIHESTFSTTKKASIETVGHTPILFCSISFPPLQYFFIHRDQPTIPTTTICVAANNTVLGMIR